MNQEKQREAYEKMLKKCPDILTPMKANRWSPAAKTQSILHSKTARSNPIHTRAVTSSPGTPSSITSSRPQTIKASDIVSEVIRNVKQFTASAMAIGSALG